MSNDEFRSGRPFFLTATVFLTAIMVVIVGTVFVPSYSRSPLSDPDYTWLNRATTDELYEIIIREQRAYNHADSTIHKSLLVTRTALYELEEKLKKSPNNQELIREQVRLRVEEARLNKLWITTALPLKKRAETAQKILNQRVADKVDSEN